jgi:tRNA pseudouridine65 synthase
VPSADGIIDHPLIEETDRLENMPETYVRLPQQAVTRFCRLAEVDIAVPVGRYPSSRYALMKLQPLTGRRRQLRRHLKHLHHPIIGDTTYGDGRHNRFFRDRFHCQRLLLHAAQLVFAHPVTGASTVITAPMDEEFAHLTTALGWESDINKLLCGGFHD